MDIKRLFIAFALLFVAVVILSGQSDFITGFITRTGQLTIGNAIPVIHNVTLDGQLATSNPTDVIINPIENSVKTVLIKVTIEDANGNCNKFDSDNGTAYLCDGTGECNEGNADHIVYLNYNSTDGQWGPGNKYCNISGTVDLQFFEINGTWTINVTLTDGINYSTPVDKKWTYGELAAFNYAPGGVVNMGTLNLDTWNNGTGAEILKNTGNIILDIYWNATNFTGQTHGDKLIIDGTNYIIDDDSLSPDDTNNIPQKFINESNAVRVKFVPESGLLRCSSVACNNENATYTIYWHLYVPAGLREDTYTNTIEVTSLYH
ncbi:MAG: hypothetical protein QW051_00815 [Candidatus Aenigmatarchaeota archaeon]